MSEPRQIPFIEHLEILRRHIIRSVVAVLVISVGAFVCKEMVFDGIILAPARSDFWTYVVFCRLSHLLYMGDSLCIGKDLHFTIVNITMSGQFTTHLMVSIVSGLVIASPYVIFEMWSFLREGLTEKEIKYVKGVVLWSSTLFLTGILFGYFLITPLSVQFLANYQVSMSVANTISLQSYINSVVWITLSCGIVFMLPIFIYFLSKAGLVSSAFMKKYRKHAIVVILVIAAIITPPDVTSQILVALPLWLLYEISVIIAKKVNQ